MRFRVQIDPEKCMGCGACVESCTLKEGNVNFKPKRHHGFREP
jgi:ferredoxin